VLSRIASPVIVLLVWQLVCEMGWVAPQFLPAPTAIVLRGISWAQTAEFWGHFGITVYRLLLGLLIAVALGLFLGLWAQLSQVSGAIINALVRLLAPIPKIALYPAFILILGFENTSKIALVVADALFPVLLATWAAARTVDQKLIWSAQAAGTSRLACVYK